MRLLPFIAAVIIGLAVGALGMWCWRSYQAPTISGEPVLPPEPPPTKPQSGTARERAPVGQLTRMLRDSHWTDKAAAQVALLTEEVWQISGLEFSKQQRTLMARFAGLGLHEGVMPVIERHPEMAPLLALSGDPAKLATVFADVNDYELAMIESLLKQYPWEPEAAQLLAVLESQDTRRLLLDLLDKGFLGAEKLLMCPRQEGSHCEYLGWVTDVLRKQINSSQNPDPGRFALFSFLLADAPGIQKRMAEPGSSFRREFPSKLWVRFVELAGPDRWDTYASVPGLWTVLEDPRGVELTKKYMHLPFFLYEKYPEQTERKLVRQALLKPDELMIAAMTLCGDEPLFRRFMTRDDITEKARRGIYLHVAKVGDAPWTDANDMTSAQIEDQQRQAAEARHKLLEYLWKLTSGALDQEYGARPESTRDIPLIGNLCMLGEKWGTARKVTGADWGAAGLDVLKGALMFVAPGAGSVTAVAIGHEVATQSVDAVRTAVSDYAREQFLSQLQQSTLPKGKLGTSAMSTASPVRRSYVISVVLRQASLLTQPRADAPVVDAMPVFQLLAEQSGVGMRGLKKLAARRVGLLARRGDRRYFAAVVDEGVKDLPQGLAGVLKKSSVEGMLRDQRDPGDLERAWRRNVYAWWTALITEQ